MQLGGMYAIGEVATPPGPATTTTAPAPPPDDKAPSKFSENLKKYAPYIIGGIVVYYLLSKNK
jgi:ATP synthase j chain